MNLTINLLRSIAKNAGLPTKGLKKAQIEEIVRDSRDGRRELYRLENEEFAAATLETVKKQGTVVIKAPELLPLPTMPTGTMHDFSALGNYENEKRRVESENKYRIKVYHYRINAVVKAAKADESTRFGWSGGGYCNTDPASDFTLGIWKGRA